MASNAPDGIGAEASNEGLGEVQGMDDQDQAEISDAALASEVSDDKAAQEQKWKTMAFNILGTIVGLNPISMALGHLSLGNNSIAAGLGATAAGLGPIGSIAASITASDDPTDAALGVVNSQVSNMTGKVTGDIVGGLTNSGLAAMGAAAISKDQTEGMLSSAQDSAKKQGLANQSSAQNQGLANQAQSLAEGRDNTRYTTRGMFNPYINPYVNRNLT